MITNLRMDLRFKLYPPPAAGRAIYVFACECLRVLRRFQSGRGFWRLPPVTARWSEGRHVEGKRVEGKICNDKSMRQCLFPWNFNQFFSLVEILKRVILLMKVNSKHSYRSYFYFKCFAFIKQTIRISSNNLQHTPKSVTARYT